MKWLFGLALFISQNYPPQQFQKESSRCSSFWFFSIYISTCQWTTYLSSDKEKCNITFPWICLIESNMWQFAIQYCMIYKFKKIHREQNKNTQIRFEEKIHIFFLLMLKTLFERLTSYFLSQSQQIFQDLFHILTDN